MGEAIHRACVALGHGPVGARFLQRVVARDEMVGAPGGGRGFDRWAACPGGEYTALDYPATVNGAYGAGGRPRAGSSVRWTGARS